jgi:glutathione S-transferase
MADSLVVWGVGTTRTFRVHWLAHELGLDYETQRIESRTGETTTDSYTRLNPKQKIPLLVHGSLVISESYAIMHYLSALVGDHAPADVLLIDDYQASVAGRAKYDEWLSFILMELDATSLYVIRRHKDLPEIYGEAPAAVTSSLEYFSRMLSSVESEIPADAPVWGSNFSELDVLLTVSLDWATFLGVPLPDNIAAYHALMQARPAYQSARAHNFRDLQLPTIPKGR